MDPTNLTIAFTVWAAVVAIVGGAIVWELAKLRGDVQFLRNIVTHIQIEIQGRITAIETHLQMKDGFVPNRYMGMEK